MLPVRHPLAGEDAVGLRALADEPLLRYAAPPRRGPPCGTPTPPRRRPVAARPGRPRLEEILAYVRAGSGTVPVPESVAAVFPRPDIAYVPVTDVAPGTVALAWDGNRPSPLVDTFVDATRATASGVTRPTPGSTPAP